MFFMSVCCPRVSFISRTTHCAPPKIAESLEELGEVFISNVWHSDKQLLVRVKEFSVGEVIFWRVGSLRIEGKYYVVYLETWPFHSLVDPKIC